MRAVSAVPRSDIEKDRGLERFRAVAETESVGRADICWIIFGSASRCGGVPMRDIHSSSAGMTQMNSASKP